MQSIREGKSPTFSESPLSAVALFLPPWLTCLWEKLRGGGKSRIDLRPLRCHRKEGEEEEERFFSFLSFPTVSRLLNEARGKEEETACLSPPYIFTVGTIAAAF